MVLTSAPAGSSTPPIQPINYHVFLSFRGPDARLSFVSHLYHALVQKGVVTFKDDKKLRRGKAIWKQLCKAIEQSMFSIVVFSQYYAFSSWCLNELQKIMESSQDKGRTVLPVFYGIDPSDIRYQNAKVAEAFEKHKRRFSDDKIQGWKKALTEAANLSGWETEDRDEAEIVEDIAKLVWSKLCDKLPSNFEHLVGDIQSKVDTIISLLKIGLDDICFTGITGMGGIGKTTLARLVYDVVRNKFDACCFIANVREHGLVYLQKKLLYDIGVGEPKINDSFYGAEIIRNFLCHKKVLMVLDDVSDRSQLDNLAKNKKWFGAGSKIIITTRDVQLLTQQYEQFEEYRVGTLDPNESLELLCQKAFKKDELEQGYLDLSKEVIECACGLPLALEVLGSFLCKRNQSQWRDTLDKLKQDLPKDISKSLRISYDGLEDEEYKEIFLDIACFFNGKKKFDVTNILKIRGLHPIIGIEVLIEKSLLSSFQSNSNSRQNAYTGEDMHDRLQEMRRDIFLPTFMYHKLLDEASQESLHMHDLLQEMGRNIVFQESPSDAGRRSRLWSLEDIDLVLKGNKGTENVQSIVLESIVPDLRHHFEANWHHDCFSKMQNLTLLDLSRVHLSHNLSSLPSALKFLRWDCYALESLPPINQLYELQSLQMCSSKIKKLWDGTPSLYNLRMIDLSNSDLKETPNFSGTPNLEKLVLDYCVKLVQVHDSVGQLKKLVELSLRYCTNLVRLPTFLDMNNLEVFILCECSDLEKLPEFGRSMRRLCLLDVRGTMITEIPSSIIHLINLKYLDLSSWHILKSIPELPRNLFIRASNYPFLDSTSDLQYLIASCVSKGPIHLFYDSKRFDFLGGEGIPRWFIRQEHHHSKDKSGELVTITADIPCDIADYEGECSAIAVCIVFESLSEAWRGFSLNWKFQDYCHPNNMSHGTNKMSSNAVFESQHYLGYHIDKKDCRNYVGFYPIDAEGCQQPPSDMVGQVDSKLYYPTTNAIPFGKSFHDNPHAEIDSRVYTGFYPIDKKNCRPHPSGAGSQVDLTLCFPTTNTIGSKKGHFRNLEVADCRWRLVCNKDLDASSSDFQEGGCCLNSDQVCELESLQLFSSKINELWNGAPFLDKLRIINLNGCEYLIETPDFSGTPNLEKLLLMYCSKLVRVHESVGQLKKLIMLSLEYCDNLVTLPSYLEIDKLEELILLGCHMLEKLPEFSKNMTNLHFFDVRETSIIKIPSSIIHLINLKYLCLGVCRDLKSIPKLPPNLIIYASTNSSSSTTSSSCPLDALKPASALPHLFASYVSKGPIHVFDDFFCRSFPWNEGMSRYFERWEHRRSKDSSGEVITITVDIPCDIANHEEECWAIVVCILFQGSAGWRDFCINWNFQDYCHHSTNNKSHKTRFRSDWRIYLGFYPIDKELYCQQHPSGVGNQLHLTLFFLTKVNDSMGRHYEKLEIVKCGWRLLRKKDFDTCSAISTGDYDANRSMPSSISLSTFPDRKEYFDAWSASSSGEFDANRSMPSSISLLPFPENGSMETGSGQEKDGMETEECGRNPVGSKDLDAWNASSARDFINADRSTPSSISSPAFPKLPQTHGKTTGLRTKSRKNSKGPLDLQTSRFVNAPDQPRSRRQTTTNPSQTNSTQTRPRKTCKDPSDIQTSRNTSNQTRPRRTTTNPSQTNGLRTKPKETCKNPSDLQTSRFVNPPSQPRPRQTSTNSSQTNSMRMKPGKTSKDPANLQTSRFVNTPDKPRPRQTTTNPLQRTKPRESCKDPSNLQSSRSVNAPDQPRPRQRTTTNPSQTNSLQTRPKKTSKDTSNLQTSRFVHAPDQPRPRQSRCTKTDNELHLTKTGDNTGNLLQGKSS